MIYSDILKQSNLHRGAAVDTVLGKWFINEGLQTLAIDYDTACRRQTATVVCTAGIWADLPDRCIRIVDCVISGTRVPHDDYAASLGQIQTTTDVTLDLTYLVAPVDVVNDSDVPDVHELFHKTLALFMAARDRQRIFADEESDAMRLMSEFRQMAHAANARLSNLKGTRRTMKAGALR